MVYIKAFKRIIQRLEAQTVVKSLVNMKHKLSEFYNNLDSCECSKNKG